jgi:5-methylcytosine-specific restriction endonuclease McrA
LCVARGDLERAVIDYTAKPLSPWSFEPDHIQPVDTHPHLALVEANLRPAHSRCNRQRCNSELLKPADAQQREWIRPSW